MKKPKTQKLTELKKLVEDTMLWYLKFNIKAKDVEWRYRNDRFEFKPISLKSEGWR